MKPVSFYHTKAFSSFQIKPHFSGMIHTIISLVNVLIAMGNPNECGMGVLKKKSSKFFFTFKNVLYV